MRAALTLTALLTLVLAPGCASTPDTSSYGNSSASTKRGEIITETVTTTYLDGRVEVTVLETCQDCALEEAVGGAGSDQLYESIITITGMLLSVASIVIQALR